MKSLTLLALLLCCSAQPVHEIAQQAPPVQCTSFDDPPPLDCPMCGGDVVMHQKRTRILAKIQVTLVMWYEAHSHYER